jgi:hypothetical protein
MINRSLKSAFFPIKMKFVCSSNTHFSRCYKINRAFIGIVPIDILLFVRVYLCLTCEIFFIRLCLFELDLMHTCRKERAYQEYDRFGEGSF